MGMYHQLMKMAYHLTARITSCLTNRELTGLVHTLPVKRGPTPSAGRVVSPQGSISSRRIASKSGPVLAWRRSAGESYPWSPSHDQCGMLRPFGTSSAEWWYRDIVVVVAQAK